MVFAVSGLALVGFLSRFSPSSLMASYQVTRTKTSTAVAATAAIGTEQRASRPHRVFCYGDSLTAGTSGFDLYPYAPYLEKQLPDDSARVAWIGLPGWTAASMWEERDSPKVGLKAALERYTQEQQNTGPPVSLVIIMAGTNDMGFGYGADGILDHILKLHQICFDMGVPRTLAIGIPPSGYQSMVPAAAELAATVNEKLRAYCAEHSHTSTFVDFPFAFERDGENWFPDGLHFTQRGYQVLGESLAPTVARILSSLDA